MMAQSSNMQRRVMRVVAAVAVCVTLWQLLLNHDSVQFLPRLGLFGSANEKSTLEFILQANKEAHLDLTPSIKYSRRCFTAAKGKGPKPDRHDIVKVTQPFTKSIIELELNQPGPVHVTEPCPTVPLPLSDGYSTTAKYPDLTFGMATLYARLLESLDTIAHWASGRDTLLVVVVEDYHKHEAEMKTLLAAYKKRHIKAIFMPPYAANHSMSQSHFMVLNRMVEESPHSKWFGLLDDDTFFPDLAPLSAALGTLDHENKDMYVGGLAEDWGSISRFGLMAYGGAGAYLSAHLARKMGDMDQALRCLEESPPELGDIIIRDCVYRHSNARLTVLPDLRQHDMLGDLRGYFESGAQPLNLHHWKSWYREPVVAMARATSFCGDCFLQRWAFGTDTVLSNGYSITVYADGLESIDFEKMERTWGNVYGAEDPKYGYTIGPTRDKLPDNKHKTYYLKHTELDGRARKMRQLYVWKGGEGISDEVVELVWTR
ncbi:hypothetical protein Micbo1qcDRAFT_150237 [Microdochium bolleyi]|uniref:Fringe-like glycosyltransferase domain-containing protein n=1 Tax=Microdochium bolleyi TaxID=196109 RepID=A0A136IVW1_9PEZI|nr:hypothetical protein Micbo1qcDRAFT_150237 [Microdochium bolleyi]